MWVGLLGSLCIRMDHEVDWDIVTEGIHKDKNSSEKLIRKYTPMINIIIFSYFLYVNVLPVYLKKHEI